ncbi:hypothetical protein F5B21DRAFT_463308 [Xylaria acuta]|nr:hypothetical protein F5B21DRAFT_463308 [Xylaria acuta]
MSSNRGQSNSKGQGRDKPLPPLPPATNFDDLLTKIDVPSYPPKPKKAPTLIKRAGTITRQIMIGPTMNERTSGGSIDKAHMERQAREDQARAAERKAAEKRVQRLQNLRHVVLSQGKSPRAGDLYDLATYEGVYLDPRPSSKNRISDRDRLELAAFIVARVAGPMAEGKYKGEYFFLGSSKRMYVGRNEWGADARQLPLEDEHHFGHIREIARAYYSLCS